MTPRAVFLFGLVLLPGASGPAAERPREIILPADTELYQPSELPGYALVNASCLTCHSVEYTKYQPPASPRPYWKATATKMQKIFGAPIPDAQLELIVDYLVKTYGAERPVAPAPAVAKP